MPRLLIYLLILILLAACSGPTIVPMPTPPAQPSPTATRVALQRVSPEPTAAPGTPTPEITRLPHLEAPLVWLLRADAQPDLALVSDALNSRLAELGFNARVELRLVDALHYDQEVTRLAAEGTLPDLLTSGGAVYENGAANGWFYPISAQVAPGLWQSLPEPAWQAVRRAGKVYGVPGMGPWARPLGVAIRADVLAGLGQDTRLLQINTFADLTALLAVIQAGITAGQLDPALRTALGPVDLLRPEAGGYEPLAGHFAIRVVDGAGGPAGQIVDWYQTGEALELAQLRREWAELGLDSGRIYDPAGWQELCEAGRYAVVVGVLGAPNRCGFAWVEKPLAPVFLSTDAITAGLTAVGAKDDERALRALLLLDLLRVDPTLVNLLALGIEGRHWQWNADHSTVTLLPEDPAAAPGYRPDLADQLGRSVLRYPITSEEAMAWQTMLGWNAAAVASPALGFRLDARPVAGPLAAMHGQERELAGSLVNGRVQDVAGALQRLDEQLDALGAVPVSAELVRQLAAWRANP